MHLQKMILKKKKSCFEEDLGKNRNKSEEFLQVLKLLALNSYKARKSKICLKKDGATQFEALENANTFKRLAGGRQKNYQEHLTNLLVKQQKTTTPRLHAAYPMAEFSNVSEQVIKKSLLSLDTSKAAGMDQIPAKFLRDGAEVLALLLGNIINLSIKSSTFPKTTDLFHFCHYYQK